MKVLVVDDAPSSGMLISAIVSALGHVAIRALSGEEAIDRYVSERPDLILMDVTLPQMDGYEATRRLRAIGGTGWVPVIFLSASQTSEDVAKGIEAGGDDYLTKPIDQVILMAKIRAMQRIAQMREELLSVSAQLQVSNEELARLANMDGLTGIGNRRYFDLHIAQALKTRLANDEPVSLLMMDVDYFKRFNDSLGHQQGDDCLRRVAGALRDAADAGDVVARYGGEEFTLLLPGASPEDAIAKAARVRQAIHALDIDHPTSNVAGRVTVSIGVATMSPDVPEPLPSWLIAHADAALYRAKQAGRDRCAV